MIDSFDLWYGSVYGVKYSPARCVLSGATGRYNPEMSLNEVDCPTCQDSGSRLVAEPQFTYGRCGGMELIKDRKGNKVICHICNLDVVGHLVNLGSE